MPPRCTTAGTSSTAPRTGSGLPATFRQSGSAPTTTNKRTRCSAGKTAYVVKRWVGDGGTDGTGVIHQLQSVGRLGPRGSAVRGGWWRVAPLSGSAWLCEGCGEKVLGALRKVSEYCDVCQKGNP